MIIEIKLTEEEIREAQIQYLISKGMIVGEWEVTSHYVALGQITVDTEGKKDE